MSRTTQSNFPRSDFSDFIPRVKNSLLTLAAVLLCVVLSLRLQSLDRAVAGKTEESGERISSELYKTVSFGHLQTAVDLIWLHILEDPSISHIQLGNHPSVYYQLDLATDLDPAFYQAYVGGANLLAIIRDDGADARDLLLKGERFRKEELPRYSEDFRASFWGGSWGIPLLLAYTYLFEMNDMPQAALAFSAAAAIPGSPAYLQHLVERLQKPGGQFAVGIQLLDFLINSPQDERTKAGYQRKRDSLFLSQLLFQINAGFAVEIKRLKLKLSSPAEAQRHWIEFCQRNHKSDHDPFGGTLLWSPEEKRIVSTTPHQKVFGLE